jgi:anion-transporting  ArsA/GET3 family ATPase
MARMTLDSCIADKRIIVCMGSGGVGKTTISATIAFCCAMAGKKTLVLTIDPARRLANSLGLSSLGNEETLISEEAFQRIGLRPAGSLYAMMLDTKTAFDQVIQKVSPNEEVAGKILENSFYQNLSTAMAGSHEYLAMERLYDIYNQGRYDTIVLDTPPTRQALDFLDAPRRISDFLDKDVLKWFVKPYFSAGRTGLRMLNQTGRVVFKVIERITGAGFIKDVSDFFLGFSDVFDDFKREADEVFEVLRGDEVVFLLVMSPSRMPIEEARFFYEKLEDYGLPIGGFIINRLHPDFLAGSEGGVGPAPGAAADREARRHSIEIAAQRHLGEFAPALMETFDRVQTLAEIDEARVAEFTSSLTRPTPFWSVPFLDEDVYDLAGLKQMAGHLFGDGAGCTP